MSVRANGTKDAQAIRERRSQLLTPRPTVRPTLEVITRTLPDRLRTALTLDGHWTQTLLVDPGRNGVPASHVRLRHHEPWADFVWVLDDDDEGTDPTLPTHLVPGVELYVFKVHLGEFDEAVPLPVEWAAREVEYGFVSPTNLVVSRELWMRTRSCWGEHYDGDWPWIEACCAAAQSEVWVDRVIASVDVAHHGD